ncbi:unnamed protein product [Pedinophyceae sp. YPF-701]|nr:unnamed protein product [Pedinophyceae sp. YPF-701]
MIESVMQKRREARQKAYDEMWNDGKGSHHPDYDPYVFGKDAVKASRATEELYNHIARGEVKGVYEKLAEGADPNFVFGAAYSCPAGYTPLMAAAHRGHVEIARALLRAGADPNFQNGAGDLALFWAIDGGPEMIQLFVDYGCELDKETPKGWTALSYAIAKGKYGATEERGIYPEDVLQYYGACKVGEGGPPALGSRSPRESFNREKDNFMVERGSYQKVTAHP